MPGKQDYLTLTEKWSQREFQEALGHLGLPKDGLLEELRTRLHMESKNWALKRAIFRVHTKRDGGEEDIAELRRRSRKRSCPVEWEEIDPKTGEPRQSVVQIKRLDLSHGSRVPSLHPDEQRPMSLPHTKVLYDAAIIPLIPKRWEFGPQNSTYAVGIWDPAITEALFSPCPDSSEVRVLIRFFRYNPTAPARDEYPEGLAITIGGDFEMSPIRTSADLDLPDRPLDITKLVVESAVFKSRHLLSRNDSLDVGIDWDQKRDELFLFSTQIVRRMPPEPKRTDVLVWSPDTWDINDSAMLSLFGRFGAIQRVDPYPNPPKRRIKMHGSIWSVPLALHTVRFSSADAVAAVAKAAKESESFRYPDGTILEARLHSSGQEITLTTPPPPKKKRRRKAPLAPASNLNLSKAPAGLTPLLRKAANLDLRAPTTLELRDMRVLRLSEPIPRGFIVTKIARSDSVHCLQRAFEEFGAIARVTRPLNRHAIVVFCDEDGAKKALRNGIRRELRCCGRAGPHVVLFWPITNLLLNAIRSTNSSIFDDK